ncbi:hypothetical protein [Lacticaseibacillus hulanensis]|uniref:hypothetical protein n=1 Tax=Lacticaseibacillus hulanensis TaxID=2493111 RepID=UPI000FDB9779|nr:hypothetical protein [Lacticaseibacillus hulanensis]
MEEAGGLNAKRLLSPRYGWGVFFATVVVTAHIAFALLPDSRCLDGVRIDKTTALSWIGLNTSPTSTQCFYYLLPLFAALGPGRAIVEDFITGFNRHLLQRGPWRYLCQNLTVTFLVGMATAVFALTVDYLFSWLLLPDIQSDLILDYGISVDPSYTYFTQLFFRHALGTIVIYIVLAGLITAGFSLLGALVGLVSLNLYAAMATPMVVSLVLATAATSLPKLIASPVAIMITDSPNPLPQFSSFVIGLLACYLLMFGGIAIAFWRRAVR